MSKDLLVRRLAERIARLEQRVNTYTTPQLVYSSIDDGYIVERDAEGRTIGRIGRQTDGSHGYVVVDGPTPPTPTDPDVEGAVGTFVVRWDGAFTDADIPTADHVGVEVHVSTDDNFAPDLDVRSSTRHALITNPEGGEVTIAKPAGTYFVRLITRTRPGRYGEPSGAVAVEVQPLMSQGDLEALADALDEAEQAIETLREVDLPALTQRLEDTEAAILEVTETTLPELQDALAENASKVAAAKSRLDTAFGVDQAVNVPNLVDQAKTDALTQAAADAEAKAEAAEAAAKAYTDAVAGDLADDIEQAQQAATVAMQTASGKNKVTYSTGDPDTLGETVGDIWRKRDANDNTILAEWRWSGGTTLAGWTPVDYGDGVLRSLDVGKLTTGSATIEQAVINVLAARIATVIELNADRIVAGTISGERINTTALAAAIANIIELSADRITAGVLDSDRLNTNEIAARIANVIQLNADRIVSGTIDTDRLNANEIAAQIANIVQVRAENILAGTITANITLQGRLQTSATGQRVVIDDNAITQYDLNGEVSFTTEDGNVHARGEFAALDEDGKGVIIGPIEPLNNKDSKAAIEFPMNIPETYARPPMIYTRGGYNVQDPDDSDFALRIVGAGIWDYWEERPKITLESNGDLFHYNDILNNIDLDAEWVHVNLKGTHPNRRFAVDTDDIRAFLVDALGDATVHRNLTAGGTVQGATVRATGQVQGQSANINNGAIQLNSSGTVQAANVTATGYVNAGELRQGGVAFERVFEGTAVFTPASGITLQSAKAVVTPHSVTVHIYLSGVSTTSGPQDVNLGTLHNNIPRPTGYFLPWHGWRTGNNYAMGLVSHVNGSIALRYATASGSGALIVNATWPY